MSRENKTTGEEADWHSDRNNNWETNAGGILFTGFGIPRGREEKYETAAGTGSGVLYTGPGRMNAERRGGSVMPRVNRAIEKLKRKKRQGGTK